jgi:hypothetical protein
MEESLYNKIRKETNDSEEIHNNIIKSIGNVRSKQINQLNSEFKDLWFIDGEGYESHGELTRAKANIKDLFSFDEALEIIYTEIKPSFDQREN